MLVLRTQIVFVLDRQIIRNHVVWRSNTNFDWSILNSKDNNGAFITTTLYPFASAQMFYISIYLFRYYYQEAISKAQEAQYTEVAAVLRSACPSAAPSTTPSRAWLEAFAAGLKKELDEAKRPVTSQPAVTSQPDESRLNELRAQNEHLQGLVDKYKRIIDDTVSFYSNFFFINFGKKQLKHLEYACKNSDVGCTLKTCFQRDRVLLLRFFTT